MYFCCRSNYDGLFGFNTVTSKHSEVVLTASELDAMAVTQATNLPALALPKGDSHLPLKVRTKQCCVFSSSFQFSCWAGVRGLRCYLSPRGFPGFLQTMYPVSNWKQFSVPHASVYHSSRIAGRIVLNCFEFQILVKKMREKYVVDYGNSVGTLMQVSSS